MADLIRTFDELTTTEQASAGGSRLHLPLAIDYSAQWAITQAAGEVAREVGTVTRSALERALTGGVPPVDLLVRTGGEQRLSDFLLWEAAYAELFFTDVLWPDFRREHLAASLADFGRRERRFGGLVALVGVTTPEAVRAAG